MLIFSLEIVPTFQFYINYLKLFCWVSYITWWTFKIILSQEIKNSYICIINIFMIKVINDLTNLASLNVNELPSEALKCQRLQCENASLIGFQSFQSWLSKTLRNLRWGEWRSLNPSRSSVQLAVHTVEYFHCQVNR